MHRLINDLGGPPSPACAEDPGLEADNVRLLIENEQLHRAMTSRAVIDQARGMVMALAPCSSERAWLLLVNVSQRSNVKLRDVAAALIATTEGQELSAELRGELRRALVRVRADRQ